MTTASAVMVKVSDLKANGYHKVRSEFKEVQKALELLNYIDFLSATSASPADNLEIPIEDGEIKLTRKDLNQLFFAAQANDIELEKNNVSLITDEAQAAIRKVLEDRRNKRLSDMEKRIESLMYTAQQSATHMQTTLSEARKERINLEVFKGEDQTKFIPDVMQAITESNWNFHRFHGGNMEFINRTDVFLVYTNRKTNESYSVNCGKFKVVININNMSLIVYKSSHNIIGTTSTHMHPHCLDSHTPCWGNAAGLYQKLVLTGDIGGVLKLIDSLLANYNPDSPYIEIHRFAQLAKERDEREAAEYGQRKEREARAKDAPQPTTTGDGNEWDDEDTIDDELEEEFIDDDGGNDD